ncbi:hypothetical protein ARMSODRAFT_981808 [Armillaria solidipes]|uniref:Uncharacterized protein n=1 Tax=Armillaria solidipes TaxID=1076256 RepID=A0A2H3B8Z9_9AGAR|nr:hypothetical protein ARMSODRAFT_981808 [Armillaria solidipes]
MPAISGGLGCIRTNVAAASKALYSFEKRDFMLAVPTEAATYFKMANFSYWDASTDRNQAIVKAFLGGGRQRGRSHATTFSFTPVNEAFPHRIEGRVSKKYRWVAGPVFIIDVFMNRRAVPADWRSQKIRRRLSTGQLISSRRGRSKATVFHSYPLHKVTIKKSCRTGLRQGVRNNDSEGNLTERVKAFAWTHFHLLEISFRRGEFCF